MNHLYIEPLGGLANRMRVIASALDLKRQFGSEIFCIWNENPELNAPFNELFEDIDDLNVIQKSKKMKKLKPTFGVNSISRLLAKMNNKLLGFDHYIRSNEVKKFVESDVLYDMIRNNKGSIYLRSHIIDYKWDTEHLKRVFRPVRSIMERVDHIYSGFGQFSKVLGLHIRRTDNEKAIANSPIELFVNQIEDEIKQDRNVGFYLATDDPDIEYLLLKFYPGKMITAQKNLRRDSLDGIQDALVDMFTLSKTSMIYGSYWSSFSAMSAKISGVDCVTLMKKD